MLQALKFLSVILGISVFHMGCLEHDQALSPASQYHQVIAPEITGTTPDQATTAPPTQVENNQEIKITLTAKPITDTIREIIKTPKTKVQTESHTSEARKLHHNVERAQKIYKSQDYINTELSYQKLASMGDARGYYGLGVLYSTYYYDRQNRDIPPNYPKALECFQKAAHLGNTQAYIKLGDLYVEAKGVFQNPQKAIEYYQKGANLGDAQGYYKLGILYRDGKGVPPNFQKAVLYFEKAEKMGNVMAGLALGVMYRDAQGVLQDYAKALKHFQKAAHRGSAIAYTLLGDTYMNGYGVPKNTQKAKTYYAKAITLEHKPRNETPIDQDSLLDLLRLPQKATHYLSQNTFLIPPPNKLKSAYLKQWYTPWESMKVIRKHQKIFWMQYSFFKPGYRQDGTRHNLKELRRIYEDMDIPHYPSVALKAVILTNTSVRAAPTEMSYYLTQYSYPSDLWQNSLIFAGTPVLITHYNKAKTYALIQSSFTTGWVRVRDIAPIRTKTIQQILNLKDYLTPLKDRVSSGARIGQIFLKVPHTSNKIYTFSKDAQGFAQLTQTLINPKNFVPFPRPFTPQAMAAVLDMMLGQRYGWGGLDQNRDCSAFTRDSFAGFGVFLPRNSLAQVRYARNTIDLHKMSPSQKEAFIVKHATPFATILWLNGHIMLYLGTYHNQLIVAHSIWSISISKIRKREHVYHVEKAVITTLKLGEEHKHLATQPNFLIDRIRAMSDLYPNTP
ncbi:SH3 domain-containing protein [Helicobacter baculiformis]|uniref:beta-lactamase n=1 Tax=Helicobacter baculiformis TaxID=427351 RepID=A0ABV7ZIL6_9HELI|nr:SH3 domain-containing protein [Helicobacter baculiformis]